MFHYTVQSADDVFARSEASKRQRVSKVTGPVQPFKVPSASGEQTENPLLREIEERARRAIQERRKNLPGTASSVSLSTTIWANELTLEIGAQMVHDVRANVAANIDGCSVCYMIAGMGNTIHKSGNSCPKLPLTPLIEGWPKFKDGLKFVPGIMCYHCLLPTVCASFDPLRRGC